MDTCGENTDVVESKNNISDMKEDSRLAKRLCYLLRYGAEKEGLHIYEGGYVDLDEVMVLNLMRFDTRDDVIGEVNTSLSHRGAKRFEMKELGSKQLIRSKTARHFRKNPCHSGSKVHTLLEHCLDFVSSNLELFDLQDFPEEFLINNMIHRLKREKKLNNAALRQLLVPTLENLDLDSVYLTEGTLKLIWRSCPHLRVLSLKDCGYIMTDNLMEQTVKKLQDLESLNLCACKHLTDRTIRALGKWTKNLKHLNLSWIRTISENALIDLIRSCPTLEHLDIYDHRVSSEGIQTMTELARGRNLTIVLRGLTDSEVAPEDPNAMLPNFGKSFF